MIPLDLSVSATQFAKFGTEPFDTLKVFLKVFIFEKVRRQRQKHEGAQWLSGRVLDSRPKGGSPASLCCVLEQETLIQA